MNKDLKNLILSPLNLLYRISPKIEIQVLYFLKLHKKLDLKNPKTINEKMNWLKLYYRNDLMPKCADKYTARDYHSERIWRILTKALLAWREPRGYSF